jgi:hypothetical protein
MSETSYEIVKYIPEYKNQVIELQKHLWSPDAAVNAAYFEWKYEQNPYINAPLIYLAVCQGQVVGMRGMYGAKWQVGNSGQTFLGPCSGDSLIAPDHRGNRGLFKKLIIAHLNDLANSGYVYTFALSANPISRLSLLIMAYRSIGSVQRMQWEARQQRLQEGENRAISGRVMRYANKLPFFSSAKKHPPFYFLDKNSVKRRVGRYVSVERTPRPEGMAELVERIGTDGRIRHLKDRHYFSWRFNNPLSSYRFLFWEGSRLEGYLVLQTKFDNSTLRVNIVDWEATNQQVQSDLLEAALRLGKFDSLGILTATLPDEVKALLERNGFRVLGEAKSKAQYRPTVLVRPVRDDMLNSDWTIEGCSLLDLSNWDLRMIYSDGT